MNMNIKIPLFLQRDKTRLVKTYVWNTRLDDKDTKFYIYLFETNKGNRSITVDTIYPGIKNIMYVIKQYDLYHEVIYPWLHGKYDPTIPSYERAGEIEMITEKNKIKPFRLVK